jgi:hypothetical protein
VTSSVSSLKERGRVKLGFTGLSSVFWAVGGMLDWPASPVTGPGARGLPCSPIAADPGRVEGMRSLPTRASNTGLASLPTRPGRSHTPVSIMTRQFPLYPRG